MDSRLHVLYVLPQKEDKEGHNHMEGGPIAHLKDFFAEGGFQRMTYRRLGSAVFRSTVNV